MNYNNKNFTVVWTPVSTTAIATEALTTAQVGQTITLTNGSAITNPMNGVTTSTYTIPVGNVRSISFISTVNGAQFSVTGRNIAINAGNNLLKTPTIVTETVTCTNAGTTYTTTNQFTGQIYVTLVAAAAPLTVNVGLNGGYTMPFTADVFNSVSNYSVAFSNITGGMSANLQYSLDNSTYYTANITQPPFVVTPTGTVNPVAANSMVSFINIPLKFIRVLVANNQAGTMTVTTMQQGGRY